MGNPSQAAEILRKEAQEYKERSKLLSKEKLKAIDELTDISVSGELKFKIINLTTVIDDQITLYEKICTHIIECRWLLQKSEVIEIAKKSGIFDLVKVHDKALEYYAKLILNSLRQQKKALLQKSWISIARLDFFFRRHKKQEKKEYYLKSFSVFHHHFMLESAALERFMERAEKMREDLSEALEATRALESVASDGEIIELIHKAKKAEMEGLTNKFEYYKSEIDKRLSSKLSKNRFGTMAYKNVKWTLKKMLPFYPVLPFGTTEAVAISLVLLTLIEYTFIITIERDSVIHFVSHMKHILDLHRAKQFEFT